MITAETFAEKIWKLTHKKQEEMITGSRERGFMEKWANLG